MKQNFRNYTPKRKEDTPADRVPLPFSTFLRLDELGITLEQLFQKAQIPLNILNQARIYLTTEQFFAAWQAIENLTEIENAGLQIGDGAKLKQMDPVFAVGLHSETFGEALYHVSRYKSLVFPEEMKIVYIGNTVYLQFHWQHSNIEVPKTLVDATFSTIHSLVTQGSGKLINPIKIELARPHFNISTYEEHFKCEVVTGSDLNSLVYSLESLEVPFVTRNPDMLDTLLVGLETRMKNISTNSDIEQLAYSKLLQLVQVQQQNIALLAKDLNFTQRTLQRKLSDAGTSYQELLEKVRFDLAIRMLAETNYSNGEIAFYLGFKEINSFIRAFKRRANCTPFQWRTRQE